MPNNTDDEFYDPREEEAGTTTEGEQQPKPPRVRPPHNPFWHECRPPIMGNLPPHFQQYYAPYGGWCPPHGMPPPPNHHPLANFDVGMGVVLQGEEGLSAYEVAVKNGFEGTESEWLESLKGKDGFPRTLKADVTIYGDEARVTVEEKEDNVVVFHFTLPENYAPSSEGESTGSTGLGMSLGMGLGSTYNGGGS